MDFQALINSMNEQSMNERSNYHLTYGQLIDALKNAPPEATVDERFKGIGSWRGSYIEVAIFTDENGFYAEREEFTDYSNYAEKYDQWEKDNVVKADKLPTNANELGNLLESLLGLQFVGYKGGNYTISVNKPLWLCVDGGNSGDTAIIGIDENLKFITKKID